MFLYSIVLYMHVRIYLFINLHSKKGEIQKGLQRGLQEKNTESYNVKE